VIRDLGKVARVESERGGYATTRGAPRFVMVGGKHYAVGGGRAYECDSIAEACGKRDAMISAARAHLVCVCGARFADHADKAPHIGDGDCDGFRLAGRRRR
jgi:hypothetical protein